MGMETNLNWGRLYQQGRCKAVGVAWSDEEAHAVHVLGIPAEYVRLGVLTPEDLEAKKAKIDKEKDPLLHKDKEELLRLAHVKGINATSAADKETLINLLEEGKAPKKAEKPKKVEKPEEADEVVGDKPKSKPKKGKKC